MITFPEANAISSGRYSWQGRPAWASAEMIV